MTPKLDAGIFISWKLSVDRVKLICRYKKMPGTDPTRQGPADTVMTAAEDPVSWSWATGSAPPPTIDRQRASVSFSATLNWLNANACSDS
jgi:hypothetical protein